MSRNKNRKRSRKQLEALPRRPSSEPSQQQLPSVGGSIQISQQRAFSGPIPPPEFLKEYALVYVFVHGTRERRKERESKARIMAGG